LTSFDKLLEALLNNFSLVFRIQLFEVKKKSANWKPPLFIQVSKLIASIDASCCELAKNLNTETVREKLIDIILYYD